VSASELQSTESYFRNNV